jgi:hypothetical protein
MSTLMLVVRDRPNYVGGFLIQQVSRSAPGIFSALIMVWVVSFAYRRIILPDHRNRMQAETEASQA